MTTRKVLILDDEPDIRELLALTLERMGINCVLSENLGEAFQQLATQHFDLCLTDMRLPDGEGLELVKYIQESHADLPVAVITAHGSIDIATESLKAGAFDFLTKPIELNRLRNLIENALLLGEGAPKESMGENILIGESSQVDQVRKMALKVSRSLVPVLIQGESGTGKEIVARLIHHNSPRVDKPFIAINCGAIPSELMESEFFGHKKGSFTGAMQDKIGFFQAAEGGTLFLDEVAELPMSMQVKLLRVVQEKAIRRIGDQNETSVDVRILSATNKDLDSMVDSGIFRHDLYFRLNVIEISLPPLRERIEDLKLLTAHILEKYTGEGTGPYTIQPGALDALARYDFPGNIRELENILERALVLSENQVIHAGDLRLPSISPLTEQGRPNSTDMPSNLSRGDQSLEAYLQKIERSEIYDALEQSQWKQTKAAKLLGLSTRQLRYKMTKFGLLK